MEVSTITNFKTVQNSQQNKRTNRAYVGYQTNNVKNNNSPNFGFFGIDDLFCWGARKLNQHREKLRYEQIENVHKKVGNDIELVAKRFGISREKAAEKYQEDLNLGGIEPQKNGNERGLNRVIGYSLEKLEMIKNVVVPIIKSNQARRLGKEVPKDIVVPNGIIIHGGPGTGKSHMAESLMEHLKTKGIDTITINRPWYEGDTDDNIFAIWKTFEGARGSRNHTAIQINGIDSILNHPNADLLKTEIAYQTQHPAQDGITWIATTNDKTKLPNWMFDKNRTSIVMPMGEMKTDAETSAVLSHFIAKTQRRDKTNHDEILNYMKIKDIPKLPGKIKEMVDGIDKNLTQKDYWGQNRTFDSWDIGCHKESVKNEDMKRAIEKLHKKRSEQEFNSGTKNFSNNPFKNNEGN